MGIYNNYVILSSSVAQHNTSQLDQFLDLTAFEISVCEISCLDPMKGMLNDIKNVLGTKEDVPQELGLYGKCILITSLLEKLSFLLNLQTSKFQFLLNLTCFNQNSKSYQENIFLIPCPTPVQLLHVSYFNTQSNTRN